VTSSPPPDPRRGALPWSRFDRRTFLAGAAGAGLAAALGGCGGGKAGEERPDLVRGENERPGTTEWQLDPSAVDARALRAPALEAYCSRTSVRAGDSLELMVSADPPGPVLVDLYRMGWYGGSGGRQVAQLGPFRAERQPEPPVGEHRLRECRWEAAATIDVGDDWPSGVYLAKLTAERTRAQSYAVFVLRDDRACDFLFQASDTTWCAYNGWPGDWSLYHVGPRAGYWGPDVRVSFDRPYIKPWHDHTLPLTHGSGEFLSLELPLAFWLEREGYDVSYISNLDTRSDGENLLRAKAFISVGHDEYWSVAMFEHVKAAVAAGVSAAFLCGNTCNGVLGFYPSSAGAPDRVIERIGQWGPIDPRNYELGWEEMRRFERKDYPSEATLIGARHIFPWWGVGDWICRAEEHWIFAGTGMRNGDAVPGLVGWEWEGDPAEIPGLEVVASGPTTAGPDWYEGTYTATVYPGPKGNVVFNAASIWWAAGLSAPPGYVAPRYDSLGGPRGPDPRVQRITANVLGRMRSA
jgi:hypothetical protein